MSTAKSGRLLIAVDRGGRCGVAAVEQRGGRRRQVPAGGEAHDADAILADLEILGIPARVANRLQHVLLHGRVVIARAETVLQDERGHAARRQEPRDLVALVIHRERAVSAAGTDDDGRAGGLRRGRQVDRQRRDVRILLAERAGSAVWPQHDRAGRAHGLHPVLGEDAGAERQHRHEHGGDDARHVHSIRYPLPVIRYPFAGRQRTTGNGQRQRATTTDNGQRKS